MVLCFIWGLDYNFNNYTFRKCLGVLFKYILPEG